jgi:nucleoid-associated protein YgaU
VNREAKIGLLVALAFLLVIGLLLSDHVTVATREPPAPLKVTGLDVQSSLSIPGQPTGGVILPDHHPAPAPKPHVYRPDAPEPTLEIYVGRPDGPPDATLSQTRPPVVEASDSGPWDSGAAAYIDGGQPVAEDDVATSTGTAITGLAAEAEAAGEPIERIQNTGRTATQDYVVRPGDTLGGLAKRFLGSDSPENRRILTDLNPSLAADPHLIVLGRTYQVPATGVPTRLEPRPTPAVPQEGNYYTVKPGDNLWKIAKRELGSASRRKEILALNRDVLSDPDELKVGQRLRLPA